MPLPAGTMRIYQADSRGNTLFAGEDHIDHTPKDEEVSLHVGNAFDVVAERKQTDYKVVRRQVLRDGVRNHAAQPQGRCPITVEVNEPIGGDWEMLNSTLQVDQDGGVRRAVPRAGGQGRHVGAALPRARALVDCAATAAFAFPALRRSADLRGSAACDEILRVPDAVGDSSDNDARHSRSWRDFRRRIG